MTKEVEKIVQLGKDSIVKRALSLIGKGVVIENFAKIRVKTNGEEIYVSFTNPIKYLPPNTIFYFDVGVHLMEKLTYYSLVSNPENYKKETIPFYKPTEEANKHIQFVIKAINKSNEVGSVEVKSFEDDMIIRENKDYYEISLVSESQESWYKIKKVSGKIYDVGHAHMEPPPIEDEDSEVLIEIK